MLQFHLSVNIRAAAFILTIALLITRVTIPNFHYIYFDLFKPCFGTGVPNLMAPKVNSLVYFSKGGRRFKFASFVINRIDMKIVCE